VEEVWRIGVGKGCTIVRVEGWRGWEGEEWRIGDMKMGRGEGLERVRGVVWVEGWRCWEGWRGGEVVRVSTEKWRVGGGGKMEDMEGMEGLRGWRLEKLEENWINCGHEKTFPFPAGFSLQTFWPKKRVKGWEELLNLNILSNRERFGGCGSCLVRQEEGSVKPGQ
jgi:hypothetical protein